MLFRSPAGTRTIKSLFYCREEVESQYNEWLNSRVGSSDEEPQFSTAAVGSYIETAIEKLRAVDAPALEEDLSRAISRLEAVAADLSGDAESIDGTLGDIEKVLERSLLENWDKAALAAIKRSIAGELRPYKADMEAETYRSTLDLMVLKRLREEAGIPRLGLFYM